MTTLKFYDTEPEEEAYKFNSVASQHKFAQKVFTILLAQLTLTFTFIRILLYKRSLVDHVTQYPNLFWLTLGIFGTFYLSFSCCESCRRQAPMNLIAFIMFAFSFALFCAMAAMVHGLVEVATAVAFASFVCFAILIYLFQTDFRFTGYSAYIVVVATWLLIIILLSTVDSAFITPLFIRGAILGLILVTYFIFDLKLMLSGSHFTRLTSPDDHLYAALNLYVDIVKFLVHFLSDVFRP